MSTARMVGVLGLAWAVMGVDSARAEDKAALGRIAVPVQGLVDWEEGTLEGWILFEFDPAEPEPGNWRGVGSCLNLDIPKSATDLGAGLNVSFGLRNEARRETDPVKSRCVMRVGFVIDGREVPHPMLVDCTAFGRGQWHHIAVTWRGGRHVRVYLDGKEAGVMNFPWSIRRDMTSAARLIIGHVGWFKDNRVAVDEVRLSSVARRPEELGCHQVPLTPDIYTTFLANFDDAPAEGGPRVLRPYMANGAVPPEGFAVTGGRIIPGRGGRGFAFSPEPPKDK